MCMKRKNGLSSPEKGTKDRKIFRGTTRNSPFGALSSGADTPSTHNGGHTGQTLVREAFQAAAPGRKPVYLC